MKPSIPLLSLFVAAVASESITRDAPRRYLSPTAAEVDAGAFDLQMFAQAPSAELTSLMVGKEATFNAAATPTATHIADTNNWDASNETLERPGATKAVGQNDEPTGMFVGKYDLSVEPDPDNLGTWLLLALGAESIAANAANPTVPTGTPTLTSATTVGATVLPFSSAAGYIAGNGFRVDAGLATQEDFVIASVSGLNVTVSTAAKYQHASGAAIAPCGLAYDHTFTLSSPRSSFTAQVNRVLAQLNYTGCKIGQLNFTLSPKQILQCKVTGPYASEGIAGSPTSPTYSNVNPFIFQQLANALKINGVNADATVQGWSVGIATGVVTDYPKYGGGRFPAVFPEQKTVVTLKTDLAYETETQCRNFWGGQGLTGPGSTVPSLTGSSILINSPDAVNGAAQYALQLKFGKIKPVSAPVPIPVKSYLKQSVTWKVYMSTRGANDDVTAILTNAANANSL